LKRQNPDVSKVVVKLNDSFSGEGNAILDLGLVLSQEDIQNLAKEGNHFQDNLIPEMIEKVWKSFETMKFQSKVEKWHSFKKKIPKMGWIAEEFLEGKFKKSPSGQACIEKNGEVSVIATHEQILGGDGKMSYLGCSFPANDGYRTIVQEYTRRVGECLANKGVIDHFGVDFVCVRDDEKNEWKVYCLEINLRKGGTTHPLMTLKLLTGGVYDMNTGMFISKGKSKFYMASDNVCHKELMNLVPEDISEIFALHELHYNHDTERGAVFHLMGAMSKHGKVGMTCIGDSPEDAKYIYDSTVKLLCEEASRYEGF